MAIIDRLRERLETDLSDDELGALLDEAREAIESRWGPEGEITVELEGARRTLDLGRPLDDGEPVSVHEARSPESSRVELDASDYAIENGGRTLRRRQDGAHPARRWGARVSITYTPQGSAALREEVAIKLAMLSATFRGLAKATQVGDVQISGSLTADAYTREREAILALLAPRGGLLIR